MKPITNFLIRSSCLLFCSLIASMPTAAQDITADGTTSTTVTSPDGNNFTIDDGDRAGDNLFHSFQDFSVPTNGSAFFNNVDAIENIFSRVTGGNISSIDGLIRANGSANLFLINPAGIIFGRNARLDIGGSFLGSTADSILFPNGEFSAVDLDNPPLLTINAPIGLGIRDNPENIVNTSVGQNPNGETNVTGGAVGLQVPVGETLAIVGGDVLLDDGNLTAKGGHIEIGSVRGAGEVGITETDIGFVLDYDSIDSFGDIRLENTAVVDVTAGDGGSVNVTSQDFTLNNSSIYAGIDSGLGSPDSQAGDIKVNATGIVTLDDGNIFNSVNSDAMGNSGNINIEARSLSVTNTGQIIATTWGQGDTGNVNIVAEETVSFDGRDETDRSPSRIRVNVREGARGNAGDINITTGSLEVTNRAQLVSNTEGMGDAGNIYIDARDEVFLSNSILISEVTEGTGMGDGGDITIKTGSLLLQNGSALLADTENIGDAGDIIIEARDRVVLEGEGPSAQSGSLEAGLIISNQITSTVDLREFTVSGEGGTIDITTGSLFIKDGGFITTSTFGLGDAGNLTIKADNISLDGVASDGDISLIASRVNLQAEGNGGSVAIISDNLSVTNGAQISVSTFGKGNAGTLSIEANEIEVSGGENGIFTGLFAQVWLGAMGEGGNITIDTDRLSLSDGADISVSTFGEGNAGDLNITASELVEVSGEGSGISAEVFLALGEGGNITIETANLSLSDGADISVSSTFASGDAGDLTVDASEEIALTNGYIFSQVVGEQAVGTGGNVTLNTPNLSLREGAQISVSTLGRGDAGSLDINAPSGTVTVDGGSRIRAQVNTINTEEPITGTRQGGNVTIDTGTLRLTDNGQISVTTFAEGDAGDVTVDASEEIALSSDSGIFSQVVGEQAVGTGGNVTLNTPNLSLREGAQISVSTLGRGDAGSLDINAPSGTVTVDGGSRIRAQVNTINTEEPITGTRQGGKVTIDTGTLRLTDNGQISVSTSAEGNAGDLSITATELVEVLGTEEPGTQSSISANVFGANGTGDAGNLTIETKKLVIRSSQVSSSTSGQGNAGNLTVNASESVEITGKVFSTNSDPTKPPIRNPAGLFSQVNNQGEGNGGNLTVETPRLSVGDGGKIQVAVFGKGNAGDLVIRASDIDIYDTPGKADFFQGGIFAGFQLDEDQSMAPPEGDSGGTVTIETDRLRVRDGGAVTVLTEGNGNAGILRINAQDYIEVYGEVTGATTNRIFTSKISGEATEDSTGSSGSVIIDTDQLIIRDRGKVTVSSENTSKPAGNLDITANSLRLNRGSITAETRVGQGEEGANITLKVSDLLTLRNESLISAEATENANGGNVTIDAEFIIASLNQNNDIIANAEQGAGGNINITTEGLFGLEERSSTPPNETNDIDASSEFGLDGTVSINTPDLSTFQEAIEAPEIVQLPTLGANACSGVGETARNSSFTITGKGGVPPEPTAPMNSDTIYIEGEPVNAQADFKDKEDEGVLTSVSTSSPNDMAEEKEKRKFVTLVEREEPLRLEDIIPARGAIVLENGDVILTAYPTDNVQRTPHNSNNCRGS